MIDLKKKIITAASTKAMMKRLMAGPQSLLPFAPVKGVSVKGGHSVAPKKKKNYVVRKQNPALTPKTGGLVGLRNLK